MPKGTQSVTASLKRVASPAQGGSSKQLNTGNSFAILSGEAGETPQDILGEGEMDDQPPQQQ